MQRLGLVLAGLALAMALAGTVVALTAPPADGVYATRVKDPPDPKPGGPRRMAELLG